MVTIKDVAKLANVSPSTVSHTLSGKRPISAATKEKIYSAIETLGYVPSRNASSLRKGTSGIIGCYTVDITESFTSRIIKGIEQGLAGSDLSMLLVSGIEFGNDITKAYKFLVSHNIEGLLVCHHFSSITNLFEGIKIPIVTINSMHKDMKSIITDNINGGMMAADHLVSSGMKHPAMICGLQDRLAVEHRLAGYSQRLKALGLDLARNRYIYGDYSYEHGYNAVYKLMKADSRIDGIFCVNDYIAAGAINRLIKMGYNVPNDVRILGFDNREFSQFWNIPISTIAMPLEEMGFLGISALRCAISSGVNDTELQTLQPKLIARDSTIGIPMCM